MKPFPFPFSVTIRKSKTKRKILYYTNIILIKMLLRAYLCGSFLGTQTGSVRRRHLWFRKPVVKAAFFFLFWFHSGSSLPQGWMQGLVHLSLAWTPQANGVSWALDAGQPPFGTAMGMLPKYNLLLFWFAGISLVFLLHWLVAASKYLLAVSRKTPVCSVGLPSLTTFGFV